MKLWRKLAARLEGLEVQLKELDKFKQLAAKHEFTPLSPQLRDVLNAFLVDAKNSFAAKSIAIQITYETKSSKATRQFASQLVTLLTNVGFKASGPDELTINLLPPSRDVIWGFNPEEVQEMTQLFVALRPLFFTSNIAKQELAKGSARIHLGRDVVFSPMGIVSFE